MLEQMEDYNNHSDQEANSKHNNAACHPKRVKDQTIMNEWVNPILERPLVWRPPLRLHRQLLGNIFFCITASVRETTPATREEMKRSVLMMQKRQTKTSAKMTVAEVIITAHRAVSPQVSLAQLGEEDVPHYGRTPRQTHTRQHVDSPSCS